MEITIEQTYRLIFLYWNDQHIVSTQAWEIQQLQLVFLPVESYVFVSGGQILDGILHLLPKFPVKYATFSSLITSWREELLNKTAKLLLCSSIVSFTHTLSLT